LVLATVGGLLVRACRRRLVAEEALLDRELPGDVERRRRTKRIVPFVW